MRRIISLLVLCCVAILFVCCNPNTLKNDGASATITPSAEIEDSNEDFRINLVEVEEFTMTSGDKAVMVECVIENISEQEKDVSSILCFSLALDDGVEVSSDINVLNEDGFKSTGKIALDDHLYPGETLQGIAYFSIQQNQTAQKLIFSPLDNEYWPDNENSLSIDLG